MLPLTSGTATAEIKSNVNFAQDAPESATAPQYTNNAAKSDFTVTTYTSSDKLHLNGTAVTDFTYASENGKFTIGNLASDGEYVIELNDKTKISDIAENAIDTSLFKTGGEGLIKITVLSGENKEMKIGADGKIPTNAKKIKFEFTKDYVTSGVSLGGKSASEENGAYTFDFSSDALESNKTYTLTVNGADYGTFTTGDGVFAVNQPSITADGFGSVYICLLYTSRHYDKSRVVSSYVRLVGRMAEYGLGFHNLYRCSFGCISRFARGGAGGRRVKIKTCFQYRHSCHYADGCYTCLLYTSRCV